MELQRGWPLALSCFLAVIAGFVGLVAGAGLALYGEEMERKAGGEIRSDLPPQWTGK